MAETSDGATAASAFRLEAAVWKYAPTCDMCSHHIPAGEVGIYGKREPRADDPDDPGQVLTWHLSCAGTLAEMLVDLVTATEAIVEPRTSGA